MIAFCSHPNCATRICCRQKKSQNILSRHHHKHQPLPTPRQPPIEKPGMRSRSQDAPGDFHQGTSLTARGNNDLGYLERPQLWPSEGIRHKISESGTTITANPKGPNHWPNASSFGVFATNDRVAYYPSPARCKPNKTVLLVSSQTQIHAKEKRFWILRCLQQRITPPRPIFPN